MATYAQRATAILNALAGSVVPAEARDRIATRYIEKYPRLFHPVDPNNPTAEERAQVVLQAIHRHVVNDLKSAGQKARSQQLKAAIEAAGEAAAADINRFI